MKKLGIGLLATIALVIYKVLKYVFKFIYFVLARVFIYFGLHYPILYLFFTSFLFAYDLIDFKNFDLNSMLFIIGLIISFICMIAKAFKNLIVNPKKLKELLSTKKEKKENKENETLETKEDIDNTSELLSKKEVSYPLIYYSKKNPKILIYEYETYYDVFEETENGITQIDKKDKHV